MKIAEGQILNVFKPKGPTSFDIVEEIRKLSGIKKVGHGGTLDPLASGVLVIGLGREATKKLDEVVQKEKEYVVVVKLGENSVTDDEEGQKEKISDKEPDKEEIEQILKNFIGLIDQVPPQFSAVKVGGRKAYQAARKGQAIDLKPRQVEIKEIKVLDYRYPLLKLKVTTGKGVYIRSLARDLGRKLKTGGYVKSLKRTRVGEFKIEDSVKLKDFTI